MAWLWLWSFHELCLAAFYLLGEVAGTVVVPMQSPATASLCRTLEHRPGQLPEGPRLPCTKVIPQGRGCLRVPAAWLFHRLGNEALVTRLILLGGISNG